MKTKQNGFAILEFLLILIIIAIIGGTGYFVWHSKNQTDKNLNNASTSSQNTPTASSGNSSSASTAQKYLTIKEWGVKGSYSGNVDLTYKLTSADDGEVWAQMSSIQLKQADSSCDEQSQLGGIIVRMHSGDHLRSPSGDDTGQTIESAISSGALTEYSHIGQYYYYYEHPQAVCGDSDASSTAQDTTLNAVRETAKNFVAI